MNILIQEKVEGFTILDLIFNYRRYKNPWYMRELNPSTEAVSQMYTANSRGSSALTDLLYD